MSPVPPAAAVADARLFRLMLGVFLGGGLLASSEALLVPRLQAALHLDYASALLIQLVYYAGYLLFAWPATWLTVRLGAMRAVAAALGAVAIGCMALALAQASPRFGPMLAALLLLSAGVTVLQIACNGVAATVGAGAVARFTTLQGFNSLGTVAGPLGGAWLLLGPHRAGASWLFWGFALAFGAMGLCFVAARDLLRRDEAAVPTPAGLRRLIGRRGVRGGIVAIFAYVGAEVTIGTLAVAFLMLPHGAAFGPVAAGRLVSLYWAGAMVGRFAGAWALRRMAAPRLLAGMAALATLLTLAASGLGGGAGAIALLAIGLANAVMFPTIYGLAMPGDARDVPAVSMLLCMAVVGGAVVPMLTGLVADRLSLARALIVPAGCYLVILWHAWRVGRPGVAA